MKTVCIAILVALLCLMLQATPFLTGAYTLYDIPNGADHNILKAKLLQGGYNASTISIYNSNLTSLRDVLQTFGSDVKTILTDNYWNITPGSGEMGIYRLTYGNYLKMEAEYKYTFNETSGAFTPDILTTTLDPTGTGDVYNYVFAHESNCGYRTSQGVHSNQYTWVCDESLGHHAGLALSNPRFRWTVPGHTYPRSIGYDLKFKNSTINNNRLYLTVAMKFSGLAAGEEVATIKLKVLKNVSDWTEFQDYINNPNLNNPNNYYEFILHPVNSEVSTTIYNNTYSSVLKDDNMLGNNFLFEYYIEFPNPNDPNSGYNDLLFQDGAGDFFRHINPEVYWHGNGRMEVDYIVLEDYYHREARLHGSPNVTTDVLEMTKTRLDQIRALPNSENISYFYTKDEPFQGQFSIYDKVETFLENEYGYDVSPKLLTAAHLEGTRITKPNGSRYEHYLNFLAQAKPRTIAVDAYPLQEWGSAADQLIQWNNDTDSLSVQKRIDRIVTKTYKSLAEAVRYNNDASVRETDIVYIPQIFGEFVTTSPNDPSSDIVNWRFFKPPRSMNKCLQLLPLCYSADGILDYTLLAGNHLYGTSPSQYYLAAPLMHGANYSNIHDPIDDSAFENLTEANQKIAIYGPYLQEHNWIDADCLMTYGGSESVDISPFLLGDLRVHDPNTPPPGGVPPVPLLYNGYVQCGFYDDDQQSPSFMLVNRRAVFRENGESTVAQLPVDNNFINAGSQTVVFVPSAGAETHFGSDIGLYDPYDGQLYRREGQDIRVMIDPGDGKLLEMCGTLPAEVTENSFLSNKALIEGCINIQPGVNVVTYNGTETRIKSNSVVTISNGASYTIRGRVIVEDGVNFVVSQDGCLIFDNAMCTWGQSSTIETTGGTLSINNSTMDKSENASRWAGIRATSSSQVTINNSTISDAFFNSIINSNCLITDSRITVPENSSGLVVKNTVPGYQTIIINSMPNMGFYGNTTQGSVGIALCELHNQAIICNVEFQNLNCGIYKFAIPYANDSISECHFVNCNIGIHLFNNGNGTAIQQCSFANTQPNAQCTGIHLSASSPTINQCNFSNLYQGILTEFSLISGFGFESSITESNFQNCEMGIESRSSNYRLKANYFNRNKSGIINHAGSNLNLSLDANMTLSHFLPHL